MISFFNKHRRKIAFIYIILTLIKFFTAQIDLVREEDPTIYFKWVPTLQNTFYHGGDDSVYHEYYSEVHSWYENGQYREIFHSPGGMQDAVELLYNTVIGMWWVLSAVLILFALYHLLKRKKTL